MEDSPRPEVLALLDGGVLRAGLGCDGAGGVGPTRVWYLLGAGASKEEPTTGLLWVATVVNKVAAVAGAAGVIAEGGRSCRSNSGGGSWSGKRRGGDNCSGRRRDSGGRGGTGHPRPESMSTTGLHHG